MEYSSGVVSEVGYPYKIHSTLNLNLVNFEDLDRILNSKIFLHWDEQLRAVHVILGFTPISKRFQSSKHVINVKDPRLALIDMVVPRFLTEPPPLSPQDVELSDQLVARLLYPQEETIPSDEEQEEPTLEPTQVDMEKDFEVFSQANIGESDDVSLAIEQVRKLCIADSVDMSPHNESSITANDATVKDMEVIF
nr:5'-methylthioadenosine/s-adenosylhomocysteine nucleosidase 2 [Quercus suber]